MHAGPLSWMNADLFFGWRFYRACHQMKFYLDFVRHGIGVFPRTFADVVLQAPDRKPAVEYAAATFVFVGEGRDHFVRLALDAQAAARLILAAAQCLDA